MGPAGQRGQPHAMMGVPTPLPGHIRGQMPGQVRSAMFEFFQLPDGGCPSLFRSCPFLAYVDPVGCPKPILSKARR